MNEIRYDRIYFNWYLVKDFEFLKTSVALPFENNPYGSLISIYVNRRSPYDDLLSDISKNMSSLKTGVDGICKGLYVSYYFDGAILIVTDVKKCITLAKFSPVFSDINKRLFLTSLMRNHISRHLIWNNYFFYHASAIIQKSTNESIMILGNSGSGKTTFALEAVKSGEYYFLSEDKVIVDPSHNLIYGSPIVHLRANSKDKYNKLITNLSLINGGTTERKYQAYIKTQYYHQSAMLKEIIILNQDYFAIDKSFIRMITDKPVAENSIDISQRDLYLKNEIAVYKKARNYLLAHPIFELYHIQDDLNFKVFEKRRG